jgi:hypothetical protein
MSRFCVEPLSEENRPAAMALLREQWGTTRMVSRGELWDAKDLPGFIAREGQRLVGWRPTACAAATANSRR